MDEVCPECGKSYGFPLSEYPAEIEGRKVVRALARGFYGATYVVETKPFRNKAVIKVVPVPLYQFFGKSFAKECEIHNELSQGSEHIVTIRDMGETDLQFGGVSIRCHFALMDYVEGESLRDLLDGNDLISAPKIAQIAIDLYRLLGELYRRHQFHNDLHAGNLIVERLSDTQRRPEAVDDNIKLKAVDLGSVSDKTASDPLTQRLGDVRWAAAHIRTLVERLLNHPDEVPVMDYRLATLLEEHCCLLDQVAENSRLPKFEELESQVKDAVFEKVTSPWSQKVSLKRFSDAYNAQTLYSWHVPGLIVDPDAQWLSRVTTRGPLILTGMRGCGKTMVLRSADFHARACAGDSTEDEAGRLKRLTDDGFVGFYVSATRLLGDVANAYAKLYVGYIREILRAIDHMRDVSPKAVHPDFFPVFRDAVAVYLNSGAELAECGSPRSFDRKLFNIQVDLNRGDQASELSTHPAIAFPHLAEAVRRCSPVWKNHSVLFLLDDVSTRYLDEESVKKLVSELLFSNEQCAFKFTTEAQTLELVLRAPGQHSAAWAGRDYDVFDLGYEVHQKINRRRGDGGAVFLESILKARGDHYSNHPRNTPADILGSCSLEDIAKQIASTSATSADKKRIYHGREALAGVCVGDIGDVIMLYEDILRRGTGAAIPVPPQIQSECYQAFCSRRLYDLNRRHNELKDFALSFAEASHELLDRSYVAEKNKKKRLRQYTKLYVMVTSGDIPAQFQKLRRLIDAGIFVLEGGTETPRTKTRDSDPITQFKLSYRKLFGLSNFLPLADRDRFELSGDQLEEWLTTPANGKEILLRNLTSGDAKALAKKTSAAKGKGKKSKKSTELAPKAPRARSATQLVIDYRDETLAPLTPINSPLEALESLGFLQKRVPIIRTLNNTEISKTAPTRLLLGLGFEERTLRSLENILTLCRPTDALCVRYAEGGYSEEILGLLRHSGCHLTVVDHGDLGTIEKFCGEAPATIDISGLSKPLIFCGVRRCLLESHFCFVVHAQAVKHYPSNEDIEKELQARGSSDQYGLLYALASITSGESRPYSLVPLLPSSVDESRARALCAFASAKHERLLTLLDQRDYDRIYVGVPSTKTPRSKLAKIAAEVIAKNYPNTYIVDVGKDDMEKTVEWLTNSYHSLFIEQGCNVEIGLTGSKMQTVAAAALSTVMKFSASWYVSPSSFDPERFSEGYTNSDWLSVSPR